MGRTKRKRSLRHLQSKNTNLDHEESTINLRKWLKQNDFSDPLNLELRHFTQTGRGVTSKNSIKENDVLIRVSFDLLITFDTIENSGLLQCLDKSKRFSMQFLLSFYLALEKHKGQHSFWKYYINTLPNPEPVLPWMCEPKELSIYPKGLKEAARKLEETFTEEFIHLKESILSNAFCECCKNPIIRVLGINLFKWAYVLVNTRAVYIDPKNIVSKNSSISILSDGPSMALCPFLDMFNHSDLAETKVNIIYSQGRRFYELRSMTNFKKYEQFFISYGSHDNEKLLMEYGFFIPGNIFDCAKFCFREIRDILKLSFNERQFKFIKSHRFDSSDFYISLQDVSFNLKAVLFVGFNPAILNYDSMVFSNSYSKDFDAVVLNCKKILLDYKLGIYQNNFDRLSSYGLQLSKHMELVKDFLSYRIDYVRKLNENKLFLE